MIFDKLENIENYKGYKGLYEILQYLQGIKEGALPEPNTVLIEGERFCNPVVFTSKPESECKYESHKKFIDVHYMVKGVEAIATGEIAKLHVETPYCEAKDIAFYQGPECGRYHLKPGYFMICFPSDAHKVGMMVEAPAPIEKVVVKVKYGTI